jgi:hypothetical protein
MSAPIIVRRRLRGMDSFRSVCLTPRGASLHSAWQETRLPQDTSSCDDANASCSKVRAEAGADRGGAQACSPLWAGSGTIKPTSCRACVTAERLSKEEKKYNTNIVVIAQRALSFVAAVPICMPS